MANASETADIAAEGQVEARPSRPLRLVVLGTGDFALPMFDRLCDSAHQVLALVTQPDRPRGRKQELIPSRIKQAALRRGLPVLQPENVNAADFLQTLRRLDPDLLVTAAYGQILSPDLLAVPRLGGINLHGSILPAYRGAAPVARAIQNGETETGVTIIRMTPRIDAGGMICVARTRIDPDETAGDLEGRLAELGAPLILEAVDRLSNGSAAAMPQDRTKVSKAPKLRKEDGLINWSLSALDIHNLVRAMQPWPQAFTYWIAAGDPAARPLRLIIQKTRPEDRPDSMPEGSTPGHVLEASGDRLLVAAGTGAVRLETVQMPGSRSMPVAAFLRGHRVKAGDVMTTPDEARPE